MLLVDVLLVVLVNVIKRYYDKIKLLLDYLS